MLTFSKPWLDASQSYLKFSLPVQFKDLALVEGGGAIFGIPVALKDRIPRFMNLGLSLRTVLARFTRLLGSKSATISPGRLFTPIFNAKAVRIPFLGLRSVNGTVQRIDVPRTFGETRVATAAWTGNIYVNPWISVDSPYRSPDGDPINLHAVTRQVRDDLLNTNRVERFQTLQRETFA